MKKTAKRFRAGVYYRISKKTKNDVRMQRRFCREYCLTNKIDLIEEYIDKGFSGKSKNRPALKRLLGDIDKKKFDYVLVYKIDRLGRDFLYLNTLIEEFNKKNIQFISATQNFDNFTPEGKFMLRLLTLLAEFESNMISKRTIDGLIAAKKL